MARPGERMVCDIIGQLLTKGVATHGFVHGELCICYGGEVIAGNSTSRSEGPVVIEE